MTLKSFSNQPTRITEDQLYHIFARQESRITHKQANYFFKPRIGVEVHSGNFKVNFNSHNKANEKLRNLSGRN